MDAQTATIDVQGTVYDLRFGYASLKALCVLWKTNDLNTVFSCLGKLGDAGDGTLSTDKIDTMADLIYAAIIASDKDAAHNIDSDAVADAILKDMETATAILQLFVESLPQAPASKKKAVNKTPAKKKRKK